jgi:adenylate dimethylallyltransferase
MKDSGELQIRAIVGPTGCGKSAVASSMASNLRAPVVVADRLQCFIDMPVTTARSPSADGILRYHICDRTIPDGDYPADEAFAGLLRRIDELAATHRLLVMEGGSLCLLERLAGRKELPFQLSVEIIPLANRGEHWRRLRSRAMEMLNPGDGQAGTLQELSHAWQYEQQRAFVATVNGFEAILAWCERYGIDPGRVGELPLSERELAELAAGIADAHLDHSLEQDAVLRGLFGASAIRRAATAPAGPAHRSVPPGQASKQELDLPGEEDRNPRVTVYCGGRHGNSPAYTEAALQLGRSLAAEGMDLVYGGGNIGLMGVLANATLDSGGKVVGVVPRPMIDYELAHSGLTTLRVTETMHERKALMAQLGDAFIALPGGIGTAEELLEALTWGQLGIHNKPCVLLNVEEFYTPLTELLHHFVTTQFMSAIDASRLIVASDPAAAVGLIRQAIARQKPAGAAPAQQQG